MVKEDMEKQEKQFQHHENDTGSIEVQIVKMTERINKLTTEHFKKQAKDYNSRTGLTKLISRRRKFLDYIRSKNEELYTELINSLGLRK